MSLKLKETKGWRASSVAKSVSEDPTLVLSTYKMVAVTLFPEDLMPSPGLFGQQAHMRCTDIHACKTHIHIKATGDSEVKCFTNEMILTWI